VTLGDLYSEENRNIMVHVHIPAVKEGVETFPLVKFQLKYFNVINSAFENAEAIATIARPEATPENQKMDYFLDVQRNRLNVADAIQKSKKVGDSGDLEKARDILHKAIEQIKLSISSTDELSKTMIADLNDTLNDMQDKHDYYAKAQKKMVWKEQAHKQERAVGKGGYETKAKVMMKEKFSKPQALMGPPPLPQVTLNKKIRVGNDYEEVPENKAQPALSLPGAKSTHKWKMYVRSADAEKDIEKVEFQIHPTFQPNKIMVSAAPFEVERTGWGTFTVVVKVYFQPALNKPMCQFNHDLVFEEKGEFKEYDV